MTPERIDRAIEANKRRPIDEVFERIKVLFVVGLVIDAFLVAILVGLIFMAGALSRSVHALHNTQAHIQLAQASVDQHSFENRATICVLQSKLDASEPPPPPCFDPRVLAFVPPKYSYTAAR